MNSFKNNEKYLNEGNHLSFRTPQCPKEYYVKFDLNPWRKMPNKLLSSGRGSGFGNNTKTYKLPLLCGLA